MRIKISTVIFLSLGFYTSCFAADAPNFSDFYNLYKTYSNQNDITITADLIATRLLSYPGAEITVIKGGNFDFDGANQNGFTISSGYNFSLSDGGSFSVSGNSATINSSYNTFTNTQGSVFSNLGGNVVIDNSVFANNTATSRGGVIYQSNSGSINITDSVFSGNKVTRGNGGVLYNQYKTSASFNNIIFQKNSASNYGGVAFNDGTLNVSNSSFVSNTASSGAALYNSNTMNLSNVGFYDNIGNSDSGAIYTTGNMNLSGGVFENNSGQTGGAIGNYGITGDTLYSVVSNSQFTGNSATYGGAIYNWDDMYIVDSSFYDNSAIEGGGAIFNLEALYLIANNSDIVFNGNKSSDVSNAIYSTGSLNMNAASGKNIIFNDGITGNGEININRSYIFDEENVPNTGNIILNADMSGFNGNINIYAGSVNIAENGTFFTTNNLLVMGGTLNIGNASIIASDITFNSGSTLLLSVNGVDDYGSLTADSFSISEGATLSVVLNPDAFDSSETIQVHILRSDNQIEDNFIPKINNNIYLFTQIGNGWYEVAPENDFNDVIDAVGGTENNKNTASAWQNEPLVLNVLEHDIYIRMNELLQFNAIDYIKALTAVAPTSAPLMQILSSSYISHFSSLVDSDNINKYYIANGKLWVSGFGNSGQLKSNHNYADFDMYGFGGAAGIEYSYKDITVGVSYMYQYDRLKSWARTIHAPTNGGGLYSIFDPYNFIFRSGINMFYTDINETKNVAGYRVLNDSSAYTYGGWVDAGYKFVSGNWYFSPRLGLKYTLMHQSDSTDEVEQTTAAKDLHFLTSYTDMTVKRENLFLGSVNIIPELKLGASYDFRSDKNDAVVYIRNIKYMIKGDVLPRLSFDAELNLRTVFTPVSELEFGIGIELRQDYNNYSGHIRGILRF